MHATPAALAKPAVTMGTTLFTVTGFEDSADVSVPSVTLTPTVEDAGPSLNTQLNVPELPVIEGVPEIVPFAPQLGYVAAKANEGLSTSVMVKVYVRDAGDSSTVLRPLIAETSGASFTAFTVM